MFGFRSNKSAETSERHGDNIRRGYLSLDARLEAQLQQLCLPLLQGLEEGLKSRKWQLEQLHTTCNDQEWMDEMLAFEHQLLVEQLLKDSGTQLHEVLLLSSKSHYLSRDPFELAPGVFATIIFFSVTPGQSVSCVVTNQSQCPTLTFAKSDCDSIYCAVIPAGCKYDLQVDGACMAVIYDLMQDTVIAWQQAAVTNRLWYTRHVSKYVTKEDNNLGSERWIYIFDQKYQQSGVSIQRLSKQEQLAARALHSAAHTGLLDVVLVRITQTKEYVMNGANDPEARLLKQSTKVDGWQTLSGTDVAWASTAFKPNHDLMLQASTNLGKLAVDHESHSDGMANTLIRIKEKAAYMMWPCCNRWAIFFQQEGIHAALFTLQEMIEGLQLPKCTIHQITPAPADAAAINQQSSLPRYAPFVNSCHEISRLLSVMWTNNTDAQQRIARKHTYDELASAYGLPWEDKPKDIAFDHITNKLKYADFNLETVHELIKAAKRVGWLLLSPILQRLGDNLIGDLADHLRHTASHNTSFLPHKFKDVAEACEAVLLLLGQRQHVMQVVLYKFVFSLSTAFAQYCLREPISLPHPLCERSPSLLRFRPGANECQACTAFPGSHLVILFARIFEKFRVDVGTAPGHAISLSEGIEQAHTKLIDMYQSRPFTFQLVHVTPPVRFSSTSTVSLAGSPDMIKLLATCAYKTDQYAVCSRRKQQCWNCKALHQVFDPLQKTTWHLGQDCMSATIFQQVIVELFSGKQPPPRVQLVCCN